MSNIDTRPAVTTPVQPRVTNADPNARDAQDQPLPYHPRAGQAGYIVEHVAGDLDAVKVKWDIDGAITSEKMSELRNLSIGG